ncbi:putative aminohydrolase SsnA [Diplocloster agilis]|uniref:Aminohydrolase SsnA n=1 Tax=Diplocloster agilis TaxID=2850323 RepID=A0A949JXJ3_9FIRM|nr:MULTISPECIES: putative aminohydrolase SsnA [Lachnospiraceae]MBU9737018.1 putative aminohydrolase SsnA [Diplocloster agilis]MBU9743280.1 putative aminohydrolase SsnA [Diplocloster agilis]MCU6732805.1 putative aminohydrolase SsnA [Suonthocola fibrivorans]SCI63735.1 putative chlorohydrolase/aminohydrolase [uncultured Clostridium sp.]
MLLIGNGRLITRDEKNTFFDNGAVLIDGKVIQKVGTTQELRKEYPDAEYIDAKGGVIMPALINTHEHIYSAMARGLSINGYNPDGFLDILDGMWWTIDRHLTLEQVRQSAMATYIDCIKNGVTTVFDHHASYGSVKDSLFTIQDAARELGVRTCLCYEVSDRDGTQKMREGVQENAAFIKAALAEEDDMSAGMMGLHASFTLSDDTLEYCAANKPSEAGYHIHVAEGIEDLYDSLKKYGKRIIDRLMDLNILGPKTITAHCIYVNEHEMDVLKHTDTMVVHNPESNMGNACGCPPTMEIFRHGILTGLGTDGYTHDMLESYKVANVLHKHHLCNPNAAWAEVPEMLFRNNARIANRYFRKPLGVLKAGAAADVIVAAYNPLTPMNGDNCNGHILFGMSGHDVTTTVCNGKVLMKDRVLTVVDEEKAMADCRAQAEKLWHSING